MFKLNLHAILFIKQTHKHTKPNLTNTHHIHLTNHQNAVHKNKQVHDNASVHFLSQIIIFVLKLHNRTFTPLQNNKLQFTTVVFL